MRRWHVILLSLLMIAFLAVLAGWNRTAADDQSVDFRMSQIMVKLTQIEWQLTQVRKRLDGHENRFDQIDRQLDRIRSDIEKEAEEAASTATRPAASDPALVGTWRLTRSDFADDTADPVRSGLDGTDVDPALLESNAREFVNRVERALGLAGLRLIRFNSDASYADGTGVMGMWSVYGDRLIRISRDGEVSQAAYLVSGSSLSLLFTRDQILRAVKAASETWTSVDQEWFDAAFDQRDGWRMSLIRND